MAKGEAQSQARRLDPATAFLRSGERLAVVDLGGPEARLGEDILRGFAEPGRRSIPCTYFYDRLGSAIYEEITELPEYYPARTEAAILRRIAPDLRRRLGPVPLIELGSGSSQKTRILLDAWGGPATYVPIDVSRAMLARAAEALIGEYPSLRVLALAGTYEDALDALAETPLAPERLVMFLGGTIGNFTPAATTAFFARLAEVIPAGGHFLLGFDRQPHAGKSRQLVLDAYNDRAGVTARFNMNLLVRLNRELGADFRLPAWAHDAVYDDAENQIEMYLESLEDQQVRIPALGHSYRFARGERILTEISRKLDPGAVATELTGHGFAVVEQLGDDEQRFGLVLARRSK